MRFHIHITFSRSQTKAIVKLNNYFISSRINITHFNVSTPFLERALLHQGEELFNSKVPLIVNANLYSVCVCVCLVLSSFFKFSRPVTQPCMGKTLPFFILTRREPFKEKQNPSLHVITYR